MRIVRCVFKYKQADDQRMAQEQQKRTLVFQGERTTWISPSSLRELLELKAKYPKAPVIVGNTSVGLDMKFAGVHHPIILYPTMIPDLHDVSSTANGLVIGTACGLAQLRDILREVVLKLPEEKTKIFHALLQQLKTLAGEQIRSVASLGGHIVSRGSTWDLNPVLAVGNSILNLASKDGKRQIPLSDDFLAGFENADIKPQEVIVSVFIPYSKKIAVPGQRSIDVSEALKVPGVVDVVTASDVPGENGTKDEKAYAEDEVIYVGQIICAVVAESDTQAKRGAKKVKIQYKELEPILTIEDAVKHNSYFGSEKKVEQGNIEEGFKSVDEIIEGEMHIGGQEHFYFETNSVLVVPRGEDKEMDVHVSTQYAIDVQKLVASALDVQSNKIMCHMKRVGGAFGGKNTKPSYFAVAAAVAANKTGRPVRFILERDEDMLITGGRHPFFGKYKVIEYVVLKMDNAYKIPNFRVRGHACKTHLPSNTAFRGFGFPQSALFAESYLAAVATQTGLPHEKVRELNMYEGISVTPFKEEFDAANLKRCWKECLAKSEYYSRKTSVEEFNKQNYWKKKGIAIIPMKFSVGYNTTYYHQDACQILRKRLEPIIQKNPEGKWEDWIEGGFIQGVGLYTMEEIQFSPEGEQYTLGPDAYKIPAVCDIPEQFNVYLLPNTQNPLAIYSSKGMGEAGVFLGSSVFFALRDAVAAVRKERGLPETFTLNSPLTAEQLRMACADDFTKMIPKDKPGTYKPWAIGIA
ncbi:hypothetical protein Y1Q_0008774 [Alligator mississippiensis]|uniref:FAD-binding PCMH-type domain-containing protein n=1 Tax=Alligator mississippiensis TaxID=8496 RepID=A0A151N9Y2_ALLMI|nr:hypothetical protein Y1Q_0008774 [Alligator mississippiensis]